jgi:hypothetical protein
MQTIRRSAKSGTKAVFSGKRHRQRQEATFEKQTRAIMECCVLSISLVLGAAAVAGSQRLLRACLPSRVIIPSDQHPAVEQARQREKPEESTHREKAAKLYKIGVRIAGAAKLVPTMTIFGHIASQFSMPANLHPEILPPMAAGGGLLWAALLGGQYCILSQGEKRRRQGNATILADPAVRHLAKCVEEDKKQNADFFIQAQSAAKRSQEHRRSTKGARPDAKVQNKARNNKLKAQKQQGPAPKYEIKYEIIKIKAQKRQGLAPKYRIKYYFIKIKAQKQQGLAPKYRIKYEIIKIKEQMRLKVLRGIGTTQHLAPKDKINTQKPQGLAPKYRIKYYLLNSKHKSSKALRQSTE